MRRALLPANITTDNLEGWVRRVATKAARLCSAGVARDSLLVFSNSALIAVGGLVFWMLAARRFSPDLVGLATAGTGMLVLLGTIGQLGFGVGLVRYASALGTNRNRRLAVLLLLPALVAAYISTVFALMVPFIAPSLILALPSYEAIGLFVASCTAWAGSLMADSYFLSRRMTGLLVLNNVLGALLRIGGLLLLAAPTPVALIAATAFGSFVGALLVAPIALLRPLVAEECSEPAVPRGELLGYSLWNFCTTLAATAATLVMPTLIVSFVGAAQAAAYYLVWALFSGLLMAPAALSNVLLARGSSDRERTLALLRSRRLDLAALLLVIVFVPAALGTLALCGWSYLSYGWPVLLALGSGYWPAYRALLLQAEVRLTGSQPAQAGAYATAYITIVVTALPLLPLFGVAGAGVAWSLGQWLLVVLLRRAVSVTFREGFS